MRMPLLALAGLCLAACQPESDKNNPAIATDETVAEREAAAPAAGANSFTQEQARERIEAAGYTNVTGLVQDPNGVWRGNATIAGQTQAVILDYQGNISTESSPTTDTAAPDGAHATPPANPSATTPAPTPTTPTEPNQ
jgi:hypothetical protein